jgi:hypothetical protein
MTSEDRRPVLTVGAKHADFHDPSGENIAAALSACTRAGRGTVVLSEGEYPVEASLRVTSGVTLRGEGKAVVIQRCLGGAPFASDCGFAHDRVKVPDPGKWRAGWTVALRDDRNAGGYDVNLRNIRAIDGDDLILDEPTTEDYTVEREARIDHAYPVIQIIDADDAHIEKVHVVGDAAGAFVDGCRAGGIYAFGATHLRIDGCVVEGFRGDGISFQNSPGTVVTGCVARKNEGLGLHPGTGSGRCRIEGCTSEGNQGDGLFVCWRVDHSVFEANLIRENGGHGISVGHKDTDNRFVANRIVGNRGHGVLVRDEPEYNAAHACVIETNALEDNGGPGVAAIAVLGETHGTRITGNRIADGRGDKAPGEAIHVGRRAQDTVIEHNSVTGFERRVKGE